MAIAPDGHRMALDNKIATSIIKQSLIALSLNAIKGVARMPFNATQPTITPTSLKFYKNFAVFRFPLSVLRFFIYICTLKYCERII